VENKHTNKQQRFSVLISVFNTVCYLVTEETFYEMIVVQNVLYEEVTDKFEVDTGRSTEQG
jgi:hypothetical protein